MDNANGSDWAGQIRVARKAAGLSQERLAREVDCSVAYVRMLECGYAPATSEVLPRLLRVLAALKGETPPNVAEPGGQPGSTKSDDGVMAPNAESYP